MGGKGVLSKKTQTKNINNQTRSRHGGSNKGRVAITRGPDVPKKKGATNEEQPRGEQQTKNSNRGAICTFFLQGNSHGESNNRGITTTKAKCTIKKTRTTMVGTIRGDQQ